MDKNPIIAAILGLIGLLGFNGIGHYYLNEKKKGLMLLGLGWALIAISFFIVVIVFVFINMQLSQTLVSLFELIYLCYVLVQCFDAYKLSKGESPIIKI